MQLSISKARIWRDAQLGRVNRRNLVTRQKWLNYALVILPVGAVGKDLQQGQVGSTN